jgi:antitoxin component of MazEF toxin-antitoxin module
MAIVTKVRKIGNSLGIVLPREALHALKVKEGAMLRAR